MAIKTNPWNLPPNAGADSSPMGAAIQEFIENYPEWLVYLRRDEKFRCPDHWDDAASTAFPRDLSCPVCWGFGVKMSAAIVPGRISRGSNSLLSIREGTRQQEPGFVGRIPAVIHFPRAVCPQFRDIVLVCEWGKQAQKVGMAPLGRANRVREVYKIEGADAHHLREVSWFSCSTSEFDAERDLAESVLLSHLTDLRPMEVNEGIWQQKSFW